FVTKLNPAGQVTASEYSVITGEGGGGAHATGIALDAAGNVYVAGYVGSGYTTTPGAYDTTHGQDDFDGFITKLSSTTGGGDTTPPTVAITKPSNGAWTGNSINITATAGDNVGLATIKLRGNGSVFATIPCSGTACSGTGTWV